MSKRNAPGQGRPPKPTAQKRLEGNPGKRPLNEREPQPDRGVPDPPAWLHRDEMAMRFYAELAPELDQIGVMTRIDGHGLASLCAAYSDWQRLRNRARKRDGTATDWRLQGEAQKRFMRMMTEFGLTPSSRSQIVADRLKAEGKAQEVDNPFQTLAKKTGAPQLVNTTSRRA